MLQFAIFPKDRKVFRTVNRASGFTLIELLVVIAIIALLAAILFPVFGRARDNARRSSCMSNLKQLGLAFEQYSNDYDQINLPVSDKYANNLPSGYFFNQRALLEPYIKNVQVFVCPSEAQNNINSTTGMSYSYNWNVGATWNKSGNYQMTSVIKAQASIALPAQVPLFIDAAPTGQLTWSNGFFLHNIATGPMVVGSQTKTDAGTMSVCGEGYPRMSAHLNGTNFLFADGHVKWMGRSKTVRTRFGVSIVPTWIKNEGISMTGAADSSSSNPYCGAVYNVPSPGSADIDYNADGIVGTAAPTAGNVTGYD